MIFQTKYGVALTGSTRILIPIIKRGAVDYAVSADWTPAAGDVTVSKDGGTAANIATLPTALTMGNGAGWLFAFSASEVQCKRLYVYVVDASPKAIEDQSFIIETFGDANAMYPGDPTVDNSDADTRFLNAIEGVVYGTVGAGSTTTSVVTSAINPSGAAANQFIDSHIVFRNSTTTAALRGVRRRVTASTNAANPTLTVDALPVAPASGDVFAIV